jgi:hypothetical protein
MSTVWHDVDEKVLLWLADEAPSTFPPFTLQLTIRPDDHPSEEIPGLTERQVDDALLRLESYGLMSCRGPRNETAAYAIYNSPRLTALGHRVLGAWPDLEQLSAVEALHLALAAVADNSPPEERRTLRRAVGIVGELGGAIVQTAAAGAIGQFGGASQAPPPRPSAPTTPDSGEL